MNIQTIDKFLKTKSWGEKLKQREEFILKVLSIAEEIGVKLTPSQTLQISSEY